MHALAIVTNDHTIMRHVISVASTDPHVKYHPDITHLSVLQHLSKGDKQGALSALSRTLHAAPWQTDNRRTLSEAMVHTADRQGELEPLRRFLRVNLPGGTESVEGAERRAGRVRLLAVGRLARRPRPSEGVPGEEGWREAEEGGEAEAERFLEKGVWLAPWVGRGREDLRKVRLARGHTERGLVVN